MDRLKKTLAFLWKTLLGGLFCQFPLTAVLVIGWTYRAMQRRAIRRWARISTMPEADAGSVRDALLDDRDLTTWPNWILGPKVVGSLFTNARVGLLGILNTWVVTLFPATLLALGWYAGWDNSFNKGYEQYANGIQVSLIGIALFLPVLAMLPYAQARQAITGDARAFYDLRTIFRIAVRRPTYTLGLALVYSLVSLPIAVFLIVPLFVENIAPATTDMNDVEFLAFLNRYYFRLAVFGFLAFVGVRMLASRLYCDAIVSLLQMNAMDRSALHPNEYEALERFDLLPKDAESGPPNIAVRTMRPAWRFGVASAVLIVWFSFIAQIYVREFFVYHPIRGWLNQPLIQLPWFRYVPAALENAAKAAREGVGER